MINRLHVTMSCCNAMKRLGQNCRCYKAKSESPWFPDVASRNITHYIRTYSRLLIRWHLHAFLYNQSYLYLVKFSVSNHSHSFSYHPPTYVVLKRSNIVSLASLTVILTIATPTLAPAPTVIPLRLRVIVTSWSKNLSSFLRNTPRLVQLHPIPPFQFLLSTSLKP